MMDNFHRLLSEFDRLLTKLYRPLTKLAIGVILLSLFFVSCVQIIDRNKFYKHVKEIALKEAKNRSISNAKDSMVCVVDSNRIMELNDPTKSKNRIMTSNISTYIFSQQNDFHRGESLLDVLEKTDSLLNANGLTFCVTLIVSLLASLLLYRIETMEKLVEENRGLVDKNEKLQKKTKSYYDHTVKFDNILTRVESAYNITILIGNMATMLLPTKTEVENIIISTNIGHQCTRLSFLFGEINSRINKQEMRLFFLTKDEKDILNMYLEDTIGELKRSLSFAKRIKCSDLYGIIENNEQSVKDIKEAIDALELDCVH